MIKLYTKEDLMKEKGLANEKNSEDKQKNIEPRGASIANFFKNKQNLTERIRDRLGYPN